MLRLSVSYWTKLDTWKSGDRFAFRRSLSRSVMKSPPETLPMSRSAFSSRVMSDVGVHLEVSWS